MKIQFSNSVLHLHKESKQRDKITDNTGQINFLKSHRRDIEKEMGAVQKMIQSIDVKHVWDLMAGCGFSFSIFKEHIPEVKAVLNDLDKQCCQILQDNFPDECILNQDIFNIKMNQDCGLLFLDFNNFTLNKLQKNEAQYKELFEQIHTPYLCITDSASFGFKFRNHTKYGVKDPNDYYHLLSDYFLKSFSYSVDAFFPFGSACLVLFKKGSTGRIKRIESTPIPMSFDSDMSLEL